MHDLLIAYASTEGQTRKIARHMAGLAREQGHRVTELDCPAARKPTDLRGYDGIILGASVHQGTHQKSAVACARRFHAQLASVPSAFFSVSLEAALLGEDHQNAAHDYLTSFLADAGWEPDVSRCMAGALRNTEQDFLRRLVMKLISRRQGPGIGGAGDHEFTDWDDVRRFVADFLAWAERGKRLREEGAGRIAEPPVEVRPSARG